MCGVEDRFVTEVLIGYSRGCLSATSIVGALLLLALSNRLHSGVVNICGGGSSSCRAGIIAVARDSNIPILFQVQLHIPRLKRFTLPVFRQEACKLGDAFHKFIDVFL